MKHNFSYSLRWIDEPSEETIRQLNGAKEPDLLALPKETRLSLAFKGKKDKVNITQLVLISEDDPYSNTGVTNE